MKSLPRPEAPRSGLDPTFDDSLSPIAREVIGRGEDALIAVRTRTLDHWIAAGAAWETLQQAAMHRSSSNHPTGGRYAKAYRLLEHPWPELSRIDKATRSDAIWLFRNEELVKSWLMTLTRKERDQWNHPTTVRRHYERRHPHPLSGKPPTTRKPRPSRHSRGWEPRPLGHRSREDLEAIIVEQESLIAERDREIIELSDQLEEQRRTIEQLRDDLSQERDTRRQLESVVAPATATVVRPDGEPAEIVQAITRASQEVLPPIRHGQPDWPAWARKLRLLTGQLTIIELHWLRTDNRPHLDAYERAHPGAGRGLEARITVRIAELAGDS